MAIKNRKKTRAARRGADGSRMTKHAGVATMAVGRMIPMGFPDQILTKVRYCDLLTLTSTVGSLAKYVFRWNSTFDPDSTGTGHQPLFRDTFAGIYDQYAVVSATARVKFINPGTDPIRCGVVNEDDSTSSTTVDTLCEQAHGQHTLLPGLTGSLSSHTFIIQWSCQKQLGIDPFKSETYKTAVGSNPTEESDLVVWMNDAIAGTQSAYFDIELVQTVLWTELTSPVQS